LPGTQRVRRCFDFKLMNMHSPRAVGGGQRPRTGRRRLSARCSVCLPAIGAPTLLPSHTPRPPAMSPAYLPLAPSPSPLGVPARGRDAQPEAAGGGVECHQHRLAGVPRGHARGGVSARLPACQRCLRPLFLVCMPSNTGRVLHAWPAHVSQLAGALWWRRAVWPPLRGAPCTSHPCMPPGRSVYKGFPGLGSLSL
jgi:hypothetical protein